MPEGSTFGSAADFAALSKALKEAGEGKGKDSLRGHLLAELRAIAKPILDDERRAILAVESNAQGTTSAARAAKRVGKAESAFGHSDRQIERALGKSGLRQSIARSLRIVVKDSGYSQQVGVRITTDGSRLPRGETYLPRGLDSIKGWKHPVYGTDTWVTQYGNPPGWFRSTAAAHRPLAARRINNTVQKYAAELAARLRKAA